MASLPEHTQQQICSSCLCPAGGLVTHDGDRLCERCRAVFYTAQLLFDEGITDEAEIVATLSFAAFEGQPWKPKDEEVRERFAEWFSQKHPEFELVRVVDSVPVVRLKSFMIDLIRYAGTDVPKQVRIRIFSRFAPLESVAKHYERTLLAENLSWEYSTRVCIESDATKAQLSVTVGPGKTYSLERVQRRPENPLWRRHSFPPPSLIKDICASFLGSPDERTRRGYAYALGRHGRSKTKKAENVVLACTAWYIGERAKGEAHEQVEAADRHHRIAEMLNRHLLRPLDKTELPTRSWISRETVWRDAESLSDDLQRAWFLLTTPPSSL